MKLATALAGASSLGTRSPLLMIPQGVDPLPVCGLPSLLFSLTAHVAAASFLSTSVATLFTFCLILLHLCTAKFNVSSLQGEMEMEKMEMLPSPWQRHSMRQNEDRLHALLRTAS